jgi:hypothetical protein
LRNKKQAPAPPPISNPYSNLIVSDVSQTSKASSINNLNNDLGLNENETANDLNFSIFNDNNLNSKLSSSKKIYYKVSSNF